MDLKWFLINLIQVTGMKRIVGVNYQNGEVIGVNVDGLNDKTDSDYFKRVYLAS